MQSKNLQLVVHDGFVLHLLLQLVQVVVIVELAQGVRVVSGLLVLVDFLKMEVIERTGGLLLF